MDVAADPLDRFEIFLTAPPGLEPLLRAEAEALELPAPRAVPGGVVCVGGSVEVWRANLGLRGAGRVLARIAAARITHLAQLDKWARRLPWSALFAPGAPVSVEASCRRSKLYHSGAVAQRIKAAIAAASGAAASSAAAKADEARESAEEADAPLRVMVRIEKDFCTLSVDCSGALLHKRGFKQAVGKAPLRESMAALFLRACAYRPGEPLLDPMCGSGTLPIEAAERSLGLAPGRARRFAFERFASHQPHAYAAFRETFLTTTPAVETAAPFALGFDRDEGAVAAARANAARAGLGAAARFEVQPISALSRPEGPPGLVIVNPPYGSRIGAQGPLHGLYAALGARLREVCQGWRVGLVTSEPGLARATGLPWVEPGPPTPHGALKIRLYQAGPL